MNDDDVRIAMPLVDRVWHVHEDPDECFRPSSAGGAILMFEPRGTSSTGDRHDGEIPGHVDSTPGHVLRAV